jgi:hypothetical protein
MGEAASEFLIFLSVSKMGSGAYPGPPSGKGGGQVRLLSPFNGTQFLGNGTRNLARAARLLIARPKPVAEKAEKSAKVSTQEQPEEEPTTSLADQLAELWVAASPEERELFLHEIRLIDVLEVMPAPWKVEIERRVLSGLAARFPDAKTKPALKAIQRLVDDTRLLALKPAGSA